MGAIEGAFAQLPPQAIGLDMYGVSWQVVQVAALRRACDNA
jgi:hypothetical protein